jgi:hypothetical protein
VSFPSNLFSFAGALISRPQSVAWRYIPTANQPLISYAHVIGVACFNVCTGDIGPSCALNHIPFLIPYVEDSPAPAALHSFQTHITDGKIYVTADPANTTKEKTARPPKLISSGSEVGGAGVVIVGGGSGAFHATEGLRVVSPAILLAGSNGNLTFTRMGSRRRSQSSPRKRMLP